MALTHTQFAHPSTTFLILACLFAFTKAEPCPPQQELFYSPFKAYFSPPFTPYFTNDTYYCWHYASCFFSVSTEPAKQQFAATALVMGFIPLTLKDFPWKREDPVFVLKESSWWLDILVRALGAVSKKREEGIGETKLAIYAKNPVKCSRSTLARSNRRERVVYPPRTNVNEQTN